MPDAYVLSAEDQRVLVELVRRERGRILNPNADPEPAYPNQTTDDLVVKTPSDGIPKRDGTTIFSELCDVYRENPTSTDGEKELIAITGYQLPIYNFDPIDDVGGDKFVVTSRTKAGTRYVLWEYCGDSVDT